MNIRTKFLAPFCSWARVATIEPSLFSSKAAIIMFKKEGERATEKCCSCSFFFFSFFRDCRFISFSFFFLVLFCFSSKSKHLLTSQMCYPSHRKKIRDSHFRVFKEYPQKCQIWKSETSPKQGTWLGIPLLRLVSLCQIWDLYGFCL